MAHIEFDIKDILPLVENAEKSSLRRATMEQMFERKYWRDDVKNLSENEIFASQGEHVDQAKIPPGLFLVKDHGVYLMSNGSPGLLLEDGKSHQVAYAKGFDPAQNPDWYDAAYDLLGGDDFGEFIPTEWVRTIQKLGIKTFTIYLSDDQIGYVKDVGFNRN